MGKSKKAKTRRFYIGIGSKICSRSAHIWPKELAPRGALLLWQKIVAPLGPITFLVTLAIELNQINHIWNYLMYKKQHRHMIIIFLDSSDPIPTHDQCFSWLNRSSVSLLFNIPVRKCILLVMDSVAEFSLVHWYIRPGIIWKNMLEWREYQLDSE